MGEPEKTVVKSKKGGGKADNRSGRAGKCDAKADKCDAKAGERWDGATNGVRANKRVN